MVDSGIRIDRSRDWIRESEGDSVVFKRQCNAKVYTGRVSCVVTDGYTYTSNKTITVQGDHNEGVKCGDGGGGWWVTDGDTLHWRKPGDIDTLYTPGDNTPEKEGDQGAIHYTVYYTRPGDGVIRTILTVQLQIQLSALTAAVGATAEEELRSDVDIWVIGNISGRESLVADRDTLRLPSDHHERRPDELIQIALGGGFTVIMIVTIVGCCAVRVRRARIRVGQKGRKMDLEWGSGHSVAHDYVIVHDVGRGGNRDVLHVV
eukprot:sb/3468445/